MNKLTDIYMQVEHRYTTSPGKINVYTANGEIKLGRGLNYEILSRQGKSESESENERKKERGRGNSPVQ